MPYRGIIEPGRFFAVLYVPITLLILLELQQIGSRPLLLAVALLIGVERLPLHYHLSPTYRDTDLIAAVQARPTRAVLDLAAYASWWKGQFFDLYSVHYNRPIVEGYFHWSGDRPQSRILVDNLKEFRCYFEPEQTVRTYDSVLAKQKRDGIIESLMTYDIRVVVIHKDLFGSESQCGAAPQFIDALFEEGERWEVLLESPTKRVLWLRR